MKQKKCKICKEQFTPTRQLQPTCTKMECMIEYSNKTLSKNRNNKRKENNKRKKDFYGNDKTYLKAQAQRKINEYGRLSDQLENGKRCCTCGITTGKMDGGHFLPTSSYNAIRYNVKQINQQCVKCNRFNYGMPKEYRIFMVEKYGEEYVCKLEKTKEEKRTYTVEYYKRIIKVVDKRVKRIKRKLKDIYSEDQ